MRSQWLLAAVCVGLVILPCTGADKKAVLWHPPGRITLRDWIWGPGGEARAPKPPYAFIEEGFSGTNPKIKVSDAKGDAWVVKFGGENHTEVFASRLLYALGYVSEPSYFVASGVVTGAHNLRRAKPFVASNGSFVNARFRLDDHKNFVHLDSPTWTWNDNPFAGTRELNGLKVLMMLTSNWDAKDARDGEGSNTDVYSRPATSPGVLYYAFSDWGSTMGKWGGFFQRNKWDPAGYRDQTTTFARAGSEQTIVWGYRGKHGRDVTAGISASDVRWLLKYLSAVTDEELRAGLRASGATDEQIEIYTPSIRDRIVQLQRVASPR